MLRTTLGHPAPGPVHRPRVPWPESMKERALTASHEPQPALPDPAETAPPSSRSDAGPRSASQTPRNTTRDSWQWMWKDLLVRIVPFAAASGLYARSLRRRGISAGDLPGVRRDGARGIAVGIPLALRHGAAVDHRWSHAHARDEACRWAARVGADNPRIRPLPSFGALELARDCRRHRSGWSLRRADSRPTTRPPRLALRHDCPRFRHRWVSQLGRHPAAYMDQATLCEIRGSPFPWNAPRVVAGARMARVSSQYTP